MNLGKEDNHDAELQLHGSRSPSVDGPASRLRRYREKEGRSLAGFGLHPDPPPYRSTMRWQIASPMPVPEYWLFVCRRLKSPKMLSLYSGLIPIPLSPIRKPADRRAAATPRSTRASRCLCRT